VISIVATEIDLTSDDYLHFYLSGDEGYVDPEVEKDLESLGWYSMSDDEDGFLACCKKKECSKNNEEETMSSKSVGYRPPESLLVRMLCLFLSGPAVWFMLTADDFL